MKPSPCGWPSSKARTMSTAAIGYSSPPMLMDRLMFGTFSQGNTHVWLPGLLGGGRNFAPGIPAYMLRTTSSGANTQFQVVESSAWVALPAALILFPFTVTLWTGTCHPNCGASCRSIL